MSVKVGRVDGGLDFIEDDQFLCHVQTLRLREILGAKSQERNQHAALISQMLIEGEAAQGGVRPSDEPPLHTVDLNDRDAAVPSLLSLISPQLI